MDWYYQNLIRLRIHVLEINVFLASAVSSVICHSPGSSLLIGARTSVISSLVHKHSKELGRICRLKQTEIVIPTAEGLGKQKWEKKGCDCEVKIFVMLVNAHRKKKTGPGILECFATFQVQSSQNRINPQRVLHFKLLQSGCRTGNYQSNRI